ncbi:MAG: sigma-54 dependent transcriptional regulator, partial [Desulfocurvibacter africanus]
MAKILIIDDDVQLCKALSLVVRRMGNEADCAFTLRQGLKLLKVSSFEVVILDISLPDGNGLEFLPQIKDSAGSPEVIILSGSGDPEGAELAIRNGAWSYISKPPTLTKIQLPVQRALDYHEKKRNCGQPVVLKRAGLVGESRLFLKSLELVAQAAATEANVLITGKTGTGKELFARAIHENSRRVHGPFVIVDCAALPENLVESVLLGHEKGAFTGADRRSEGLVRQAHGGTLFLDEVGELPLAMQKAFLRVLQTRRFRPIGGLTEVESNFRLVAATNRNLDELVTVWKFRQDLLFRLRTLCIELPSLRDRQDDIPRLAHYFNESACRALGIKPKMISAEFLEALGEFDWPGNVRELANAIESAITSAGSEPMLAPRHLPLNIRVRLARAPLEEHRQKAVCMRNTAVILDPENIPQLKDFRKTALEDLECCYLEQLMAFAHGDIRTACAQSGLSRARLYALLKHHAIEWAAKRAMSDQT